MREVKVAHLLQRVEHSSPAFIQLSSPVHLPAIYLACHRPEWPNRVAYFLRALPQTVIRQTLGLAQVPVHARPSTSRDCFAWSFTGRTWSTCFADNAELYRRGGFQLICGFFNNPWKN